MFYSNERLAVPAVAGLLVNGKTAHLKQQISELGFLLELHVDIYRQCALQLKLQLW